MSTKKAFVRYANNKAVAGSLIIRTKAPKVGVWKEVPYDLCCNNNTMNYKVYTALLNQSGTNAPVATVLENTLGGTPVWNRSGGGIYGCTLNSAFPANKTFCLVTYGLEEGTNVCPLLGRSNDNQVYLYARQFTTGAGIDFNNSPANDICVEIRVYP